MPFPTNKMTSTMPDQDKLLSVSSQLHHTPATRDSKKTKFSNDAPEEASSAKTAPASLADLPNEILVTIFDMATSAPNPPPYGMWQYPPGPHREQLRSLKRIARINRQMHALIHEHLSPYTDFSPSFGNPYLFLRDLVTKPETALKVRRLDLYHSHDAYTQFRGYRPSVALLRIINARIAALEVPLPVIKSTDRDDVARGILYAAILLMCNPVWIEIGGYCWDTGRDPLWLKLLKHKTSRDPTGTLFHPKSITLKGSGHGILQMEDLAYFLGLPSLESLKFGGPVEFETTPSIPPNMITRPSSIKELVYNARNTAVLTAILQHCPALEELTHELWPDASSRAVVDYHTLCDTLLQHCPNLNYLRIREQNCNPKVHMDNANNLIPPLSNMLKLKTMAISAAALVQWKAPVSREDADQLFETALRKLPRALEWLTIHNIYRPFHGPITYFLHYAAQHAHIILPNLQYLNIHYPHKEFQWVIENSQLDFEGSGIELLCDGYEGDYGTDESDEDGYTGMDSDEEVANMVWLAMMNDDNDDDDDDNDDDDDEDGDSSSGDE